MKAVGIDHVVLRVTDLARSVAFCRDVLGLEVDRRRDDLGMVHMRAGNGLVDLVDVAGKLGAPGGTAAGPTGHNMDHLCLLMEDFDAMIASAELKALGIWVGDAPRQRPNPQTSKRRRASLPPTQAPKGPASTGVSLV